MTTELVYRDDVTPATHVALDYTPQFWDPRKAYITYKPDVEAAFREGYELRRSRKLATAAQLEADGVSNACMMTDLQEGFRDEGDLPVSGTNDAVLRICARLLNGIVQDYYTRFVASYDTHVPLHISFALRWIVGRTGLPLDLHTNKAAYLELVDERQGIFQAVSPGPNGLTDMGKVQSMFNIKDTVAYAKHLEDTGQGNVWVFDSHCKVGTLGNTMHPLLQEVLAFAEGARMLECKPLFKGHLRDTDWFGPFEPCRPDKTHLQGGFQKDIVDGSFRDVAGKIDMVGVAGDFCNYYAERQLLRYFTGTPILERMRFLTDCTAFIVPDAQHVLDMHDEARDAGVHFATHDQPLN